MKDNAQFQMTVGSKYKIRSLESRDKPLITQGIFKGYAAFGHEDALVMELDDSHGEDAGKTRVLPGHMILAIDVLSTVVDKVSKGKEDETATYFG
ncbi:MAG: hypothetical protein JSW00_04535 [Thermoplasmata archaeon]|nr:MAG: hypothetical protein JSW00_04535 [Thermoplasmata archaeon]